jgi:hypothetical protein
VQQHLSMLAFLGMGASKSSIGRYTNDFELVVRSTKEVRLWGVISDGEGCRSL